MTTEIFITAKNFSWISDTTTPPIECLTREIFLPQINARKTVFSVRLVSIGRISCPVYPQLVHERVNAPRTICCVFYMKYAQLLVD